MYRNLIFALTVLISSPLLYSQSSVIQLTKTDSVRLDKVLIVPLNPKLYFSDSDHALVEYNNRTSDQLMYRWRSAIDVNVTVYIIESLGSAKTTTESSLFNESYGVHNILYGGVPP